MFKMQTFVTFALEVKKANLETDSTLLTSNLLLLPTPTMGAAIIVID